MRVGHESFVARIGCLAGFVEDGVADPHTDLRDPVRLRDGFRWAIAHPQKLTARSGPTGNFWRRPPDSNGGCVRALQLEAGDG